jgi:hypothetical protein
VPFTRRSRRTVQPLLALSLVGAAAAWALPATAQALGPAQQQAGQGAFDARAASVRDAPAVTPAPARQLARKLGTAGVVSVDPVNGTPRLVARTDGTLTGPSSAPPAQVALDYVRAHPEVFKLTDADIAALGAPQETVSPDGTHLLRWTQSVGGVPVLGADLRAAVTADGRLLEVQGAPLADRALPSGTAPKLAAASALTTVRDDNGIAGATPRVTSAATGPQRMTTFADDSSAHLVVYAGPRGNRLAWSVDSDLARNAFYTYVVDATSGAILKRDNLVRFDADDVSGTLSVWPYAPGGPAQNTGSWFQVASPIPSGWIERQRDGTVELRGDNAVTYADVDGNGVESPNEEIGPSLGIGPIGFWSYPVRRITSRPAIGGPPNCSSSYPCTWRAFERVAPGASPSWQTNIDQSATQAFWFVNNFHDYLADAPISFNAPAGNFQVGAAGGDDPLIVHTDDGANGTFVSGSDRWERHPDGAHLNNASMATPPRGQQPVMNLDLFAAFDGDTATIDGNAADDASVVYHEYTHGLSSRLVTDSSGVEALNAPQSAAMGEGWSDWYAMDYLVNQGLQPDDPNRAGDVLLGAYLTSGQPGVLRTEPIDCPVGQTSAACPHGGYTFANYGHIGAGPDAHDDGEIWAQTLWDLRSAVGARTAESLITQAMRLSPPEPSFLEERDAILLADQTLDGGADHDLIWRVFAARGMGAYASTANALDPAPIADFSMPAAPGAPTAPLSGTVTDATTGAPIAGATVWLPGMTTAVATDANGRYLIPAAAVATYPTLKVSAAGYASPGIAPVTVAAGGSARDVALRRDWALASGGAQVVGFTQPDLTGFGCGPAGAIDGTSGVGWSSYAPAFDGVNGDADGSLPDAGVGTREVTLKLTQPVNVTSFEVDPGAVCGDDDGAALGAFTIETSPDGASWSTAVIGQFGSANNHRLNQLSPVAGTGGHTQYVRLTMISPQGGGDGAFYMDLAELGVYGVGVGGDNGPGPPTVNSPGPPRKPARRDRTKPRFLSVKLKLPKKHSLRALRGKKGVPLIVKMSERARVTVTAALGVKQARSAGLVRPPRPVKTTRGKKAKKPKKPKTKAPTTFVLASVKPRWLAAKKTTTLKVIPSRAVARRLAKLRTLAFTVTVKGTDAAGNVGSKQLKARVRR